MKMTSDAVIEWPVPEDFLTSPEVTNRGLLAEKYSRTSIDEMLENYIYMNLARANAEFKIIFDLMQPHVLAGKGFEIGAGTAIFSAEAVRYFPQIEQIYAIELVPEVVRLLQRPICAAVCGADASKIQGVIGSFDDIRIEDGTQDFCIEIGSLHHSHNVGITLREMARKLKPGGLLVAIDRAQSNHMSDEQREFMLNVMYPDWWKELNGYSMAPLSRRQNGESEIRLDEWMTEFDRAGFELLNFWHLRHVTWKIFRRKCLLSIPYKIRRALNWLPSYVGPFRGELFWMLQVLLGLEAQHPLFRRAPREHTLFVLKKRG